jgi:hypothetical protein
MYHENGGCPGRRPARFGHKALTFMPQYPATMDAAFSPRARSVTRLDYGFLKKIFLVVGILLTVASAFTRDPIAFAVGGFVPWLLMMIIGRPTMPAAIALLVLWQWAQVYARELQTLADGEALGGSIFGPDVERAYWYMLASIVTLALAMRVTLGRLRSPTPQASTAHARWQPRDLVILYAATLPLSVGARFVGSLSGALGQPMEALVNIKGLALFLLFSNVLATGRGRKALIFILLFEIGSGFTGLFADFKTPFLMLAVAALASRIRWSIALSAASVILLAALVTLSIFWTAVKMEFRQFATGSEDSQAIQVSLADRMGYLGNRVLLAGSIDWGEAAYTLLTRFAYVDITASVISVQEVQPEPILLRQWGEALSHVLQPRFLFPDKPPLSDSEVYIRLARGDPADVRAGTSISVGYIGENFVDLGFPGMLVGILALGLTMGLMYRYFMTRNLPWMMREGTVLVVVFSSTQGGMETSLPKLLGAVVMVTLVYVGLVRFLYPRVLAWLDRPTAARWVGVQRLRA